MAVVDNKGSDAGMGKTYSRLQRTESVLDIGRDSVKVHGLIERSDTSSVGWAAMLDEHVHKGVFIELLLLHMFAPVTALLYIPLRGWRPTRNMNILRVDVRFLFLQSQAIVWCNLIVYLLFQPQFESRDVDIKEVFFVPMALILVHRCMVALKYAILPDEEREYMFMAEYSIAEAMNEKIQLLSGWMPLLDEVLDEEVHIASLVTGVDLCKGSFSHEVRMGDPFEAAVRWQNLLFLEDNVQELETLSVSFDTMLKGLLRKSVSTDASYRSRMVLTVSIAMVVAIIPCVFRAAKAYSVTGSTAFSVFVAAFGASSWMVCSVTVISMLVVFMTCFVALMFFIGGILHYRHKHLALHWLALMIRPLLHAHSWLPKLQLEGTSTECNTVGLVHCVNVISVLGGKYQKRLEAYALAILGVSLVGLGHIFLRIVLSGDTSSTEDDTVQMSAFDCQVLFCIVVNCTLFFYMISYGAQAE